jgi:hypothetical protein
VCELIAKRPLRSGRWPRHRYRPGRTIFSNRHVKCGPSFGAANHDVIDPALEFMTVVEEVKSFGVFAARAAATGTFPRPTRCENRVIMDRLCGRNWLWGMVSRVLSAVWGISSRRPQQR